MRYWGFVSILIQNSNLSPTPPPPFVPPLHAYSCKVQTCSVWSGKVMWVMLSFPPQTRVTFYWRHVLTLQEHCPEPVFGAVWDEVTDPTQTAWISFLTVLLPFRKSPSSVRWAHIHRDWMVPLMVINRVNSPISALKTFLQILWEFGLKTTSTVNIVIFHRRHKETWLHSP